MQDISGVCYGTWFEKLCGFVSRGTYRRMVPLVCGRSLFCHGLWGSEQKVGMPDWAQLLDGKSG